MKGWIVGVLSATVLTGAQAQVGYSPDRSPYRDRDYNRDWTFFAGQYRAQRDPVGVAPTDGPMAGVRWQMHLTGPLYFALRGAGASVQRTVINPDKLIAERVVGTERVPMLFLDAALEMSLTGHKTWHGVSPYFNGGFGLAADLRGANDVGNYRFGVPFTMTFGSGLSWSPNDVWALRADWTNYLYRISYPDTYYLKTTTDPAPRDLGQARAFWRRNRALLLGVSFLYPRR